MILQTKSVFQQGLRMAPSPHTPQPTNLSKLESVLSSLREYYPIILIHGSSDDPHFNPTDLPNSPEKH